MLPAYMLIPGKEATWALEPLILSVIGDKEVFYDSSRTEIVINSSNLAFCVTFDAPTDTFYYDGD